MKKFGIIALAALLVFAFTMPAAAIEHTFGGYFRVRAYTQHNMMGYSGDNIPLGSTIDTGLDGLIDPTFQVFASSGEITAEDKDLANVDQRTRLYYTAKFSDNFKFVNKIEWDMTWGGDADVGVDFKGVEIKNSYVDFNLSSFNFKLGAQGASIGRGFFFADDFGGAVVTYKADSVSVPFYWLRFHEGGDDVDHENDSDFDYVGVAPKFTMDSSAIQPFFFLVHSKKASGLDPRVHSYPFYFLDGIDNVDEIGTKLFAAPGLGDAEELDIYFLGLNADFKIGGASVWFTGIYEAGDIEYENESTGISDELDVDALLLAAGASTSVGGTGVHGQIFYASGQDLDEDADEIEAFWVPSDSLSRGQSYYWAEIMGYGIFDNEFPIGAPAGDKISNIMAANLGVSFKATENTKITADLWWAQLAEDDFAGNDDLGFEIDLKATIKLMDNLNLDIVGAYLFAGDSTNILAELDGVTLPGSSSPLDVDEEDPYLIGTRLSLSF